MNHTFVILTVLAYLLSWGMYIQFLYTGKEFTGRLATLLMFLGLGTHYMALLVSARASHTFPYHDLPGERRRSLAMTAAADSGDFSSTTKALPWSYCAT